MFKFLKKDKLGETASQEWRRKTLAYTDAVNAFVEKGTRDGWENAGKEPDASGREHLVDTLLKALKKNQTTASFKSLRDQWPPAHAPLVSKLSETHFQGIPAIALLDDGSIIVRSGMSYHDGSVFHIQSNKITKVPNIDYFGQGPNKRFFATVKDSGISITDGWQGPETAFCPWPTGLEDIPDGYDVEKFNAAPSVEQIIPFPDGKRVLLISEDGIFVLTPAHARRLLPTLEAQIDFYDYLKDEQPDDPLSMGLSMVHGAISHDGSMIAVGCQDGPHLVFDANYKLIGTVGHLSEYPHYAVFSRDDKIIALNSCHFYNGATIGVPTDLLGDYTSESYELADGQIELNTQDRVYAAVSTQNLFITGDAYGYIRGYDHQGKDVFKVFLGSSIGDIDISKDEKTLIASTYAGFIAKYDLEATQRAEFQIGTGEVLELERWMFWKNEKPLKW